MIRPSPRKYTCNCSWTKKVHPKSDALMRGVDYFDECPKCGSRNIKTESARSLFDLFLPK